MEWKRLRERILEKYSPEEEKLQEMQKQFRQISEIIEDNFDLETHFAGSASRGTCMKGDNDIDIFVLFPEDVSRTELEEKGLEVGKTVFEKFNAEYHVEYAEHPYTKGEIDGHDIEIVPCYDTSPSNIKSSVDRTPHHSRWVKNNLDKEHRNEVILLKAFLDAKDLYGSSLKTEGFSGYLCEILVSEFDNFQKIARKVVEWDSREIIDPENHHESQLPHELEEKFSGDSLVVIDPVDPDRNVAAVLSKENYAKFIYNCWRFRQKPGMNFFQKQERNFTDFELKQEIEKRADFLVIEFETPEEVDDIVYPQMRKTMRRLEKLLEKNDFRIYNSGFHVGDEETRIFFELDQNLPEVKELEGPKLFHAEQHIAQFRSKYDNVYVKEDRLVAKTERNFTDGKKLLKDFLNSEDLEEKGLPSAVADKMKRYSFEDTLIEDKKWLKYLGEKLHVEESKNNERS